MHDLLYYKKEILRRVTVGVIGFRDCLSLVLFGFTIGCSCNWVFKCSSLLCSKTILWGFNKEIGENLGRNTLITWLKVLFYYNINIKRYELKIC